MCVSACVRVDVRFTAKVKRPRCASDGKKKDPAKHRLLT